MVNKKQKPGLLWLDLEMTGLDPKKDKILEVAAIATDFNFNESAAFDAVVKNSLAFLESRMAGDFWDKNSETRAALIAQNKAGKPLKVVEDELLAFLDANFSPKHPIYLAGNSIHQDRKFIERYWPRLDARLHYRMLDVSAWKIYFENALNKKFTKPEQHRALDDIRGSIEELKCYLKLKS